MRRKKSQATLGSLDSLLDTMTNVVGILVIILVVTILGVQEAVSRISEQLVDKEQVSQEQYDEAVENATQTAALLQKVRNQPIPPADLTPQQRQLASLQDALSKLKPRQTSTTDELPDPDALAKQLQEQKKSLEALQKQLATAKTESKELTDRLAVIGVPVPQKPKQITIPNPRTAPEGAEAVYFICKGGRIFELPADRFLEMAEQRIKVLRRNTKSDRPPCKMIAQYFEDNEVKSRGVRLKIRISRNRVFLRFHPDEGLGETVEEMGRGSSRFKRALLTMKRNKNYARFIVWPDSYETYLAARVMTDEYKLPAGWQPMWNTSIFERWTPIICTPEEPLPPMPKPDPNAPVKPKPLPEPAID